MTTATHMLWITGRKANGASGINEPMIAAMPTTSADIDCLTPVSGTELVFFAHHHRHPDILVGGDCLDDTIQQFTLKPFFA